MLAGEAPMSLTLVLGNKNYSSWSLRPYLALAHHKIPFDEVTNIKPNNVAFFIDDHALRFKGDWQETLSELFDYHSEYLKTHR